MVHPLDHPVLLKRVTYYSRLKKLVAYMKEHPDEAIDLTRAAQIACMERTSFCRFFKRAMGINFREFIQQWRVAAAASQMMESDFSITAIAYNTGFENLTTFERTFKKLTGDTPSQYRRRHLLASNLATGNVAQAE